MRPIKPQHSPPRWSDYLPFIRRVSLFLGFGLLLYALASAAAPAQAAPGHFQEDKTSNDFCLACHQEKGLTLTLGAESLPVTINPVAFGLSVHNEEEVACVDCHTEISDYPHPEVKETSARAFSLSFAESCKECHEDQYEVAPDSVHAQALNEDKENAPLCTSCHNPHTQGRLIGKESGELTISARIHVPETCAQCHLEKYDAYKDSVHGKALTEEGNLDVPSCTNCHGVHNIEDPTTPLFRNTSPALCADCHDDPAIMDKYDISTDVYETYVADFHGTNVKLFSEQFPDGETNKAVCFDCHGVHDIANVDDPVKGAALRANLLERCQRCHPDATENFPGAWLGHRLASPTHQPIAYYVNLFYKIFIPAVIGGMLFFVITDIYRRRVNRAKGAKKA
ncbi:MAG: cytochrome c3 family protein [Anaerolineales bacterium]|nr:cytochrome c3 family protein [Anaerolineales bacterium]